MENYFENHGKQATGEEIENFLQKNNLELPNEYKEFLKEVNGGELKNYFFELRKFDTENRNSNIYAIVDEFFSLEALEDVWTYTKDDLSEYELFPIAEVRGGMIICCKQNNSINAEVYFYDNDFGVIALTKSLNEFLKSLIPESEVDYKKYGIDY